MNFAGNVRNTVLKKNSVLFKRHFWIIAAITLVLALLYNASLLRVTRFFPLFNDIVTATGIYAFVVCFLFLVPILYASALFKIKGLAITWLAFLVSILPRAFIELTSFENVLIVSLFALVALLVGLLMALDYNPNVRERVGRAISATTRVRHLARLVKIREYERQFVARKLHDSIIQSLLVIANKAQSLERGDSGDINPQAKKNLENMQIMLLHVIDDVRNLTHGLRPGILDNVGLLPVVRWQTERLSQESGVKINLDVKGMEYKLPPETEVIIYRIIQESFNNIRQHSKATRVDLVFDFAAVGFKIILHDDGQGFKTPGDLKEFANEGKYGLDRIQEQVKLLDGTIKLTSGPGSGTTMEMVFPP
jgi:two-component system, NarL family, sensor histidine kinase DegS